MSYQETETRPSASRVIPLMALSYACPFCRCRRPPVDEVQMTPTGKALLGGGLFFLLLAVAVLFVSGTFDAAVLVRVVGLHLIELWALFTVISACLRERRRLCPDCDRAV